ncbi:MAG TPA: VWA domain-containing protein [Pyrinomonadaceae bacterium]|nr:VWA domain-containing protein [Pyrinomonadaceae bacterium]
MKTLLSLVASIFFLTVAVQSQTPTPMPASTPTPAEDSDVVKISTNLIQVDVTVTDSKGNVIRDLKPEEVEVYQNGVKQQVSHFTFISSVKERTETPAVPEKGKPVRVLPPAPVRSENVRRTIALVVDDLTLSFESTNYVRNALKKFVAEQMQDGDLVAIIRTGAGIGALQQFTTDKRQLYAAIERVRWNPIGNGKIGAFAPLEAKIDTGVPTSEPQPGERTPEGIERENADFRASLFSTGTLGAIGYVVRGMQELPGRKSVLLLSDGFKLFNVDALGFRESGRVLEALRRLVDQANRASVVIHTMDARGLVYTGLTAADNTTGHSFDEIQSAESDRRSELQDTQEGLRYLARQTGGTSVINNNDIVGGIRKILDDQSYYLVGYEPSDETFDPKIRKFNRLSIKVTRPGVKVRYRSGFFGVSDEKLEASKPVGVQRLNAALTSPFGMNEIALRLNAIFGSDERRGAFIRSLVHIRANDITFNDKPDGSKEAIFDILAVGFGDNGIPVEQSGKTFTVTVTKAQYDRFIQKGFVYDFTFPIKKPGAYQLRIAIRDHASERVGSANQFIEVPNLKKDRLTLSGVVLENLTMDEIKNATASAVGSDALIDTSLRQFKSGTVLNYGFFIFNAKTDASRMPNLSSQIRLFRDGKPLFEGKPQPIAVNGSSDLKAIARNGSLVLGTSMMIPGAYVMEIAVTDNLAKTKNNTAIQYVQFEIVE